MELRLAHRAYRRRFRRPLATAHGEWAYREGFILRSEQGAAVNYAEVAPLPEFGTETVLEAAALLEQLVKNPDLPIPGTHPCCAFARSAVGAGIGALASGDHAYAVAGLLPAGRAALAELGRKLASGYRTFKWKIGVFPVAEETAIAGELLAGLPVGAQLRLDANAGLTAGELEQWLEALGEARHQIEFLEQPLPPGAEARMADLAAAGGIPIALDESLNGPEGWRWMVPGAWTGPLVIKPLLMGPLPELVARLRLVADQLVLSSVFETRVGVQNLIGLAAQLPRNSFALGFDTREAFDDGFSVAGAGPRLLSAPITPADLDELWNTLPHLT